MNNQEEKIWLSVPHMGEKELEYIHRAFETNWISSVGPHIESFEKIVADWAGLKSAVALSSGTAAIHLALIVLGIKAKDRVFCSTFTFAGGANPILYQGAIPVFIDSDKDSWNMCPLALEKAFEDGKKNNRLPKALICANLYGQSARYDKILPLCDAYQVPVIEDAAESLGASYQNKASGSFGRLGIFSFNGNKIITASSGGMLVSDDETLISKAKFLSTQAKEKKEYYEHKEIGYNYRLSNVLASIGLGQMEVLTDRVKARRDVFERYQEALSEIDCIEWMPEIEGSYPTRWLTAARINPDCSSLKAPQLVNALSSKNIEARRLWKPMHQQALYKGMDYFTGEGRVSDDLFETGFCLPSSSSMTISEQERVIASLKEFFKHG